MKITFLAVSALLMLLFAACNSASDAPLPRSMKGYELYSWQEEGEWNFTLITGTNRNKTIEEIANGENEVTEGGWINIHVESVDEIKDILDRVPQGEFVFWSGGHFVETYRSDIMLELPPAEIVDGIKKHAEKLGLEFSVASPY